MSHSRDNQTLGASFKAQEILERITDAFVALDKNWCYTYMNKKAGEIFQRDPLQMIGKHIWTEFPEGVGQPFYKAYYSAMAEQKYIYLEEHYAPYDLWFENHIYPSPEGLSIYFRDVSEKKRAEQALVEKGKFIESIIHASPDIIYIYDVEEQKNVFVNEGIQKNLGYNDAEIKEMGNQVLPLLMHPDDFNYYLTHTYPRYAAANDKEIIQHEFRMRDTRGDWHWLYCKESIFMRKTDGTPKQIFGITVDITELKETHEKLIRNETTISSILESSDDFIFSLDNNLNIIFANTNFKTLVKSATGKDIITGINFDTFVRPENKFIYDYFKRALNGERFSVEREITVQERQVYLEGFFNPVRNLQNEITGISCFIKNITRRKYAEIALMESNFSLAESQRISKTGSWTYFNDGKLVWSENMHMIYGLPEKITATTPEFFFKIIHEDDREKLQKWMQACLAGEEAGEYEFKSILPDGTTHYYRGSGELILDSNNNPDYMRGTVQDITDRKKAEEKLRESELNHTLLFEHKLAAVAYHQLIFENGKAVDYIYLNVNNAFYTLTGLANVIGKKVSEIVPGIRQSNPDLFERFARVARTGIAERYETYIAATETWYFTSLYAISENVVVSVFDNITERKKNEKEILAINEQLRNLSAHLQNIREEERVGIARDLHDELGQQLAAIKMDILWLKKNTTEKEESAQEKIAESLTMINDSIKTIRRINSGLRPAILDDLGLLAAVESLVNDFAKRLDIEFKLEVNCDELPFDKSIAIALYRIFQEAFNNILKHAQATRVIVKINCTEHNCEISIADNGIGFSITENKKNSFGLLGIKERVIMMGATLKIETQPGKGTTLLFNIPVN